MGARSGDAWDNDPSFLWPRLVLTGGYFSAIPPRSCVNGWDKLTPEQTEWARECSRLADWLNKLPAEQALAEAKAHRWYVPDWRRGA